VPVSEFGLPSVESATAPLGCRAKANLSGGSRIMALKLCYVCGNPLREGQLVEVTVIAPYKELGSKVIFSIHKPIDAYPDTLRHHDCEGITNVQI
jgi:hypothetical protein